MVSAFHNCRGTTLIETLLALAIMVLGFVTLHRLQAATIRGNNHAAQLSRAVELAEDELERALGGPFAAIASGTASRGPVLVTRTVTDDAPVPGCKTIRVEAAWPERGKMQLVTLKAVAAAP